MEEGGSERVQKERGGVSRRKDRGRERKGGRCRIMREIEKEDGRRGRRRSE